MDRPGWQLSLGKALMRSGSLKVVIADDEDVYFNERMIRAAGAAGFSNIDRISYVTHEVFESWLKDPPDIMILDVKYVVDEEVAKDGIELARVLSRKTSSMIVVTSAHQQHLRNAFVDIDYIIENRQLTSADFIHELSKIVRVYLDTKCKFYRNIIFRTGLKLVGGEVGG
jgi:hypothetical protein